MTKRTLRTRFITAGAVLGTAGLIFAGGLPAVADEDLAAPWPPNGFIFGDEVPEVTTKITPTVEVTGWPDGHVFYAGETVSLSVHVDAGVAGAPSFDGMLVGLSYGGEVLAFGEIDEEGNALVSVRPLVTGTLHFTPFFVGEGAFDSVIGEGGDIEVAAVPVTTMMWIDYMDETGTTVGYGGETLHLNGYVEPFCADEDDEAATDECYATYGVPTGTLALIRDGETIGEAVVEGPSLDAAFADVNVDLSEGARPDWTFASFTIPPILLGSPGSFEVTAGFEPNNWFTSDVAGPITIEVEPFQTALELLINGDWSDEDPVRVNAAEVLLTAFFADGDRTGAAPTGSAEFFANGTSIGVVTVGENADVDGANLLWTPIEGGEYVLKAVFTPDSLNHLGSETSEYSVLVTIPPAPNPAPVDPDPNEKVPATDTDTDKAKAAQTLAKTGGISAGLAGVAGIGLLLTGGLALMLSRRKHV